jgi:hypothetical protein
VTDPRRPLIDTPAAAAERLLLRHGGCIEDAAAVARIAQQWYTPGSASWEHYRLVLALIEGRPRAK